MLVLNSHPKQILDPINLNTVSMEDVQSLIKGGGGRKKSQLRGRDKVIVVANLGGIPLESI